MAAHFEIHVNNVEAAKAFYTGLFGWEFSAMPGGEEMGYHLASGDDFSPGSGLTLGIMKRMDESPKPGSPIRGGTMVFEVDDCDRSYQWAISNGGAETLPPTDYPGVGRCAYVEDGQGNVVGMIVSVQEESSYAN